MTFLRLFGRLLLLLIVLVLLYQLWLFGHVLWWKYENPSSTAFMRQQLAVLQESDPQAELKYDWVPYAQISPHLKRALVASEDAKFLEHEGFDWEGIQTAWEKNAKRGRISAGGSTISQQLAKNLFLSGKRSYVRKAEEAIITLMIEATWDKRRIFEVYLNVIEWGVGVYGAEAAARHYYGSSAAKLGPAQAARLAAMVPKPRFYDKNRNARGLNRKAAIIQRRMRWADIP
ncbi:monofunctional biosynthetic peptidoglycan transglycosylase [Chitinimonas taiwanensis]|uniref:monofunctional biosynthetic peptidoglycan transglycosylase n=1 Tax=Chitinimonas taiwanensis TaxID=240412 RepID=UPI0035B1061B